MEQEKSWFVYILECGDGTLYTGVTDDPGRRLRMHNAGKGAKYTRGRGPLRMRYCENIGSWGDALRRERAIKKLSRAQKLALCENFGCLELINTEGA